MKKITFLILSLAALSCEKTIEYELPEEDPKIVIDCKILAGDSITAFIGTSVHALSAEPPAAYVHGNVFLYQDQHLIDTLFLHSVIPPLYYISDHTAVAGSTYRLEVHKENFGTTSGTTTLPKESVNFSFAKEGNAITITFTDPPVFGDYYLFRIFNEERYLYFTTLDPFVETFEEDILFNNEAHKQGYRAFLSDEHFNGQERELTVQLHDETEDMEHTIELVRITSEYFRHESTKAASETGDEVFTEPVQIYSNIVNGYGIVTGGTPSRITFVP